MGRWSMTASYLQGDLDAYDSLALPRHGNGVKIRANCQLLRSIVAYQWSSPDF